MPSTGSVTVKNAVMQGCLFDPDGHYDHFDAPLRVRSFRMFRERFIP